MSAQAKWRELAVRLSSAFVTEYRVSGKLDRLVSRTANFILEDPENNESVAAGHIKIELEEDYRDMLGYYKDTQDEIKRLTIELGFELAIAAFVVSVKSAAMRRVKECRQ